MQAGRQQEGEEMSDSRTLLNFISRCPRAVAPPEELGPVSESMYVLAFLWQLDRAIGDVFAFLAAARHNDKKMRPTRQPAFLLTLL